jgi:hypothetical protein
MLAQQAFDKIRTLLPKGSSILDIGSGEESVFNNTQYNVETFDIKGTPTYKHNYNDFILDKQYDCVWASHILEHQLNVNDFLKKVGSNLKEDGYLVITVPPLRQLIVGGHVSVWLPGLLIYNLVLANFDCRNIMIKTYDYNISAILKKKTIELPALKFDRGDLKTLENYFPFGNGINAIDEVNNFQGDFTNLNWN